jgi:cytochrome c oxidase subunit 1
MAYVEQLPRPVLRVREEPSRPCAVTGLRIYAGAQALVLANAVAAVLALAAGGLFGILVGVTRAPGIEALQPNAFYVSLTGHGVAALVLWPVFFEVAALVFASSILLNARVFSPKLGWSSFFLMVSGAVMLLVSIVITEENAVMFTAYPPLVAHQIFYLGYLIFAVGAVLALVNFALSIAAARAERAWTGSLPLLTYGVAVAAILAMLSLASGLVALIPAWLYSLGWINGVDPIVYRTWFWGLGHTLQYVNVVAMVVAWYGILALCLRAGPVSQKFSRIAFILYALISLPVFGHHFLVDPSLGNEVKIVGGSIMGFMLGVPSLMHGLAVIGGAEYELRRRFSVSSLFGWLRRLRWGHAGVGALAGSLLIFAFGGWSGTVETTLPLNVVTHNTMNVPGHLHQTVVGGMTLAFMGFAYYLVPLLVRRELVSHRLAAFQVWLYTAGMLLMTSAHIWAGALGVPRRTAEIGYGGEAPSSWQLPMDLAGAGVIMAGLAGGMFILLMVATLLRGKRTEDPERLVPYGAR